MLITLGIVADFLRNFSPDHMKHSSLSSHSHRVGILVSVFALVACVLLQQQVSLQGNTLNNFALTRLQARRHMNTAAHSLSSASSLKKSASSAALHGAAPALSPRRHGTGTLVIVHTSAAPTTPIKAGCGDGILLSTEECDDGNTVSGDGCSASCTIESGFQCSSGQPSLCWSTCGDGVTAANEKCDDGNTVSGDGCSSTCKPEFGYICKGSPSVCAVPSYCGNGIVEPGEECDDGNDHSGDGCYQCKKE